MDHRKSIVEYTNTHDIKAVIFDFDGTLFPLHVDWVGLKLRLKAEFALEENMGINTLLQQIRAQEGNEGIKKAYAIVQTIEGNYDKTFLIPPTMQELVKYLANKGLRIAIVSNNMTKTIKSILTDHKLSHYFDTIIGKDSVISYKPHPEGLEKLLSQWSLKPSEVLVVGNDENDEKLSRIVGTHFYKVTL